MPLKPSGTIKLQVNQHNQNNTHTQTKKYPKANLKLEQNQDFPSFKSKITAIDIKLGLVQKNVWQKFKFELISVGFITLLPSCCVK